MRTLSDRRSLKYFVLFNLVYVCVFRIGSKKTEDGKTEYVLTFISTKRIMHSIIHVENGMFWINKSKYPSFPALVDGYMNKKKGDDYYLLTGLNNRDLPICDDDKMTLSKTSSRNQPRSLPWYHGKLSNKVHSNYVFNLVYQVKLIDITAFHYHFHCQNL